ncbi:hypothetical protein R1flu_021255 [Riccia fluitans]|uniref:PHD-type domain-containing protein n=1 Tax=Riccia fluitans TaxID=41844 RepID=A0ABD1ZPD1_9MARC
MEKQGEVAESASSFGGWKTQAYSKGYDILPVKDGQRSDLLSSLPGDMEQNRLEWKRGHLILGHPSGQNLPLDETKWDQRCTPRSRARSLEPREELLISVTQETKGVDRRKPKRRRHGDVTARDVSPGEADFREGLAKRHNLAEGLRRKKESVSRIASADVPLAVGSDLGNKRRQRAPAVCKETGGSQVEKETNASQSANGQTEENERRSERLKERRNVERKKTFEETHSIDWQAIRFSPARRTKPSGRKSQPKGKRGKTRVQANKQVKRCWTHETEKEMSPDERHDEHGSGLTWTSRLRERGKKRVLEFCAEVEVEAFAPNPRVVKQRTEKVDETFDDTSLPSSQELDDLLVLRWSRRNPRKLRTRSRFPSLMKGEPHAGNVGEPCMKGEPHVGNVGEPCGGGVDECRSIPEDEHREVPSVETTAARKNEKEEREELLQNGRHVPEELFDPSVPESAVQMGASGACEAAEAANAKAAGLDRVRTDSSSISLDEMQEGRIDGQITDIMMADVESSSSHKEEVEEKSVEVEVREKCSSCPQDIAVETTQYNACNRLTEEVEAEGCIQNFQEVVEVWKPVGCNEGARQEVVVSCTNQICTLSDPEASVQIQEHKAHNEVTHEISLANDEQRVSDELLKEKLVETACNPGITTSETVGVSHRSISEETTSEKALIVQERALQSAEREKLVEVRSNELWSETFREGMHESQENLDHSELSKEKIPQGEGKKFCNGSSSPTAFEDNAPTVCSEVVEERLFLMTNGSPRCEMSDGKTVLTAKCSNVCEKVTEVSMSAGREHVDANVVEYAQVKITESSELGVNLSLESGDESSSGNSDEETEEPRKIEDLSGNSVDDFDVLAKYCLMKPKDKDSLRILEKPVTVMLENSAVEEGTPETMEMAGQDPTIHKTSSNAESSEPVEEKSRKELDENTGTRIQSLLDDVRIEASITPEMADSSDSREMEESYQVLHTVRMTDEPPSQNAFITKERVAKYSNDFKRGFVSLGLKCALCGGSSDGKWACELQSARKFKARDTSNYATSKMPKFDVKEWGKMQVKKGWLGRLLGPLSARAGVAGMWVHELCAVWSPEVYFAGVGRLKNVKAAIRRGRLLKCSYCGQPGATIGCRVDRCPQNYHLPCAHFDGCSFDDKKYLVACSEHLHLFPSRCRRLFGCGNDVQTLHHQPGDCKQSSKLHRGNFRKMMIERRAAASTARLKDLEEEEKFMERSGEDEEFARRERKRLQRDLAKLIPTKLGGRQSDSEEVTIFDGWNSVAGLQDVIRCLKEMVILPLLYPGAFDRLGIVPPRGVLLHGHSGTGKTLVVRALAGACARGSEKISYFARKGADCLGKYVGDAERQLRLLFQVAEQHQPSIIFFDEIDGLAPSRSRDGQDQTHSSVVSTLLALMDGLSSRGSVIVIGATNRPDALDPALRRPGRFDREIYFPLPSVADRAAILALHTQSWVPRPAPEDLSAVARVTRGFAGADLRALCTDVALKALKRVAPVHRLMESAEKRGTKDSLPQLPKIKVKAADWARALKEAPPPCSMRMASDALSYTPGSPLPWYLVPPLLPGLVEVLLQLNGDGRCFMPPALFKAVSSISLELQSMEQSRKSVELGSQYRSMSLLESFGDQLQESVEAALTSAGLVGSVEALDNSGYVALSCGVSLSAEPSVSNVHSSTAPTIIPMPGGLRNGHFRVLISGKGKCGQRLVGASIIAGFEGSSETRTLNLPTMLHEGDGDVALGLSRIIGTGKCSSPLMFFMPQIESWSVVQEDMDNQYPGEAKPSCTSEIPNTTIKGVSEAAERSGAIHGDNSLSSVSGTWNVFLQHIKCLSPDTSFMFLATSHLPLDELPSKVVDFFLSCTKSSKEYHVVSRNQPVPCALVELPPLKDRAAVVERASQEISRSLAGRLVRHINHKKESSNVSYTSASSKLADPDLPADEQLKVLIPTMSSLDYKQFSAGAVEDSQPMEELSSSPVADIAELSKLSSPSLELTLKADNEGRNPLEENPAALLRPRTLVDSWSSELKALQLAIAQLSHYIINQAQFSDLRRISAGLKSGPCLNTSLIDQRFLETANHSRNISFSRDDRIFEDIFDKRDEKNTHASQLYGLEAIGLRGKSGLYSSGKEFACDISGVLNLLRERVRSKVESGKDHILYVPLLSKISGLEDVVNSWSYQIRRLEVAAEVVSGVQSGAQVEKERRDLLQPTPCEAQVASPPSTPESSRPKASLFMVPETHGVTSPRNFQSGNQNMIDTQSLHGLNGNALVDSHDMDAGASAVDNAEGCDGAPVLSVKLADERTVVDEYSQHRIVEDLSRFTSEVHPESQIENNAIPDSRRGQDRTECEDAKAVSGQMACNSGVGACHLSSEKILPRRTRVHLRTQSLQALHVSIQEMILAACNEHSVESVEHLHEIIARCAASLRVIFDRLLRKVDWAGSYHNEARCPVGSESAQEVVDGYRTEKSLLLTTICEAEQSDQGAIELLLESSSRDLSGSVDLPVVSGSSIVGDTESGRRGQDFLDQSSLGVDVS